MMGARREHMFVATTERLGDYSFPRSLRATPLYQG